MPLLPAPPSTVDGASLGDVEAWVAQHLGDLTLEGPDGVRAGGFDGGQSAADAALATLDISGYANTRSTVLPEERRGASRLSPYIRHGLLLLPQVSAAVADAPSFDRKRFRDELLWQEYARHVYARLGRRFRRALRNESPAEGRATWHRPGWDPEMACMDFVTDELHGQGWVVNQTRMWLASQWAVRAGLDWREGEQAMFVHLLDGSRAANGLGWQWTVGAGSTKAYGFSRWQVQKRAPQLCRRCPLRDACPIQEWPDVRLQRVDDRADLARGPIPAGPEEVEGEGGDAVWLTAESLGDADPALAADDDRPAVFVFDEPLLATLRLSGKRLVFLAQTLGELAARRPLEVRRGEVVTELEGRRLAATWTPVPGWQQRAARLQPVEVHPWPWLVRPRPAGIGSYSAWRRDLKV
ncbi:deoxyribodipyrimidine photo-lyase [Microlunatus sagamiharensis]|uniref:Deoxyribodipyrimidine photo-lyase n=1 Tax=Microlunatus sagamiharensis TaxID=546874 RepID=A0A1H2LI78_9ACTN|nr:FAD-binding domain-containing protein [Microlunatus sagamiharensis]SDU80619.1 deoxyribodipyrimidine photo-lyase [Microlunatus sagamiharensis]